MKVFFTTRTSHRTTGSSVKPSISDVTLSENVPWVPGIPSCMICPTYYFSIFSAVIAVFEVTSCIVILKCFNCSNYLVTLPFLLRHYIGRYNHMEMVKR